MYFSGGFIKAGRISRLQKTAKEIENLQIDDQQFSPELKRAINKLIGSSASA
jgi:hypothetical protein